MARLTCCIGYVASSRRPHSGRPRTRVPFIISHIPAGQELERLPHLFGSGSFLRWQLRQQPRLWLSEGHGEASRSSGFHQAAAVLIVLTGQLASSQELPRKRQVEAISIAIFRSHRSATLTTESSPPESIGIYRWRWGAMLEVDELCLLLYCIFTWEHAQLRALAMSPSLLSK